jgi:PleD family two-component response regulator
VVSPGHQCNLEDVLRRADEALYRAKTKGRNRVECTSS